MKLRWLLLTVCLFAGCSPAPTSETAGDQPERAGTNFERLPAILAGIGGATTLYEGLPSAFWEPQLREAEAVAQPTITLHGFRLYEEQPELSPPDAEQLKAILTDSQSFKAYNNQKNCADFHADYCVEWRTSAGTTDAFVSLECGEVMLFGLRAELHCDFTPEAAQKLKSLLARYRESRPIPE